MNTLIMTFEVCVYSSVFCTFILLMLFVVLNNQEDIFSDFHSPADIIGALRSRRWVISHDQQVM